MPNRRNFLQQSSALLSASLTAPLVTDGQHIGGSSNQKLHIIAFGAHPDDCDDKVGGTAVKYAKLGHHVKFVALTSGDNGHPTQAGGALAQRRRTEAQEASQRTGIDSYEVLDTHGGELQPTLEMRRVVANKIREWNADIVLGHRPYDYHPDHRYTGVLIQDAAYMVTVPYFDSSVPALHKNPVFLYFEDHFQTPNPFRPDVAIVVDDVIDQKVAGLDAHVSQMYEWEPFMETRESGLPVSVPQAPEARREWLQKRRVNRPISESVRQALRKWYGPLADSVHYAEAFEVCEYGSQPSRAELRRLFPFFPE